MISKSHNRNQNNKGEQHARHDHQQSEAGIPAPGAGALV
jgi:hypothetical protein